MPQQRPKKQEDVDGRILIARNVHWKLPDHLRHAIESPIAAQRLSAVQELGYLYRAGNDVVRTAVAGCVATLAADDSRSVSSAATVLQESIATGAPRSVPAPRAPAQAATPPVRVPAAPAARPLDPPPPDTSPPGPSAALPAEVPAVPPPPRVPRVPVAAVLALVVAAGVLQILSRFTVFDGVNGQTAEEAGVPTSAWVFGVGLPLVMALLLVAVRESSGWTGPLAAGLVLGAVVCQLDQALGSLAFFLDPDQGAGPGPAWWLAVAGTAALIGGLLLSRRALMDAPAVRRDWRAVAGVLVVVAALVAWLQAFSGFWVWFAGVESGLLLAALCLPLSGLSLSAAQRLAGLAAVTVYGVWLVAFALHAFAVETYLYDQRSTGIWLIATIASVAACYLAQIRPPPRRPAAEAAARR